MLSWLALFTVTVSILSGSQAVNLNPRTVTELKYSRAHSLGDNYQFDARHGWESVNITDLQYKYSRSLTKLESLATGEDSHSSLDTRELKNNESKNKSGTKPSDDTQHPSSSSSISTTVIHALDQVWKGLKGIGGLEHVKITWYTGQDLQNPSCWSQSEWAPSDSAFACALTLEGWTSKPQCFKFLELCNGPKKCVFVRVVDSCAGCNAGSKHVDLTKAAFGELASLDEGTLSVQMRLATDPSEWFENLWGPKN